MSWGIASDEVLRLVSEVKIMFGVRVGKESGGGVSGRMKEEIRASDRVRAWISTGEWVRSGMRLVITGRGPYWAHS